MSVTTSICRFSSNLHESSWYPRATIFTSKPFARFYYLETPDSRRAAPAFSFSEPRASKRFHHSKGHLMATEAQVRANQQNEARGLARSKDASDISQPWPTSCLNIIAPANRQRCTGQCRRQPVRTRSRLFFHATRFVRPLEAFLQHRVSVPLAIYLEISQ